MTCGANYMKGGKKKYGSKKHYFKGGNALMPADINAGTEIGGYAATQSSPVSNMGSTPPNLALIQSGGKSKKKRYFKGGLSPLSPFDLTGGKSKKKRYFKGGLAPLSPFELETPPQQEQTGGKQKGGYFTELVQAAVVPFGLAGLNYYAHRHSGKQPYLGRSRIGKQLRSRRNRR